MLGAVVSVAANVAHSYVRPTDLTDPQTASVWTPEAGAVIGATFWPIALLITTEIMIRTSWPPGRAWLLLRFVGLLPVAGVAGIVSYLHLHGLLQHYHEAPLTCLIAPLSVDGLMVMASSALVASNSAGPTTARHLPSASAPPDGPGRTASALPARPVPRDTPAASTSEPVTGLPDGWCEACRTRPAKATWTRPDAGHPYRLCRDCLPDADGHPPDTAAAPSADTSASHADVRTAGPARGRVSTAAAVARLLEADPDLATVDIAGRLGVTARTVRRHLAKHRTTPTHLTDHVTGHRVDARPGQDGGTSAAADLGVVRPRSPRTN